jgi:hypothetical protein
MQSETDEAHEQRHGELTGAPGCHRLDGRACAMDGA